MSAKNNDAIMAIKDRINIADLARRYIELRSNGSRLVAPCPFHQETKPSFSVNEELGTFYCFGCQATGDIFTFYGRINGLDFRESLEQLAEEAGITLDRFTQDAADKNRHGKKRNMLKMHEVAINHYTSNLKTTSGKDCRAYLQERGLSAEISEKFRLGWSQPEWQALNEILRRTGYDESCAMECGLLSRSQNGRYFDRFRQRLMFPIFNLSGQAVAFGGRVLPQLAEENDAKYINSSDSPIYKKGEHLYGLFQARKSITVKKNIMLTEGYMDVITLHQYGYTEAVGALGTALTHEQVKRLSGFSSQLELLFDGDKPGRKAALRACEMMLTRGLSCLVVLMPEGEDIDSLLRQQGIEVFEALRRNALNGIQFCIDTLHDWAPKDAIEWSRNFLKQIQMPELFSQYASRLATGLGIDEKELRGHSIAEDTTKIQVKTGTTLISHDREILTCAVRYPHAIPHLRECGADLALQTEWGKQLWAKLEDYIAKISPTGSAYELSKHDELFQQLDDQEKLFWIQNRDSVAEAPALNNENGEVQAVERMLQNMQHTTHATSVLTAIQKSGSDYETQRNYLTALVKARGRNNDL